MNGKTIAWIEDDTAIIFPVVQPLLDAGYRINQFHTVADAISRHAELQACDLILLDILAPTGRESTYPTRYTGLHLLEELRERYEVTTPVVVFSVVQPPAAWESRFEELGVLRLIRKPVLPSYLKREIEEVLAEIEASG